MREKKDEKSRKSRAASSPKERKSRKPSKAIGKDSENPLHERTRSTQGKERRNIRRDFFTDRNESNPRSSQKRGERKDSRSFNRDNERSSYRDRDEQRSSSRYNSDKHGSKNDRRDSSERRSSDRRFDRDGREERRSFHEKNERSSYRNRDEKQRSSSRYNSDRYSSKSDRRDSSERRSSDRRFDRDEREERRLSRDRWEKRDDDRQNYDNKFEKKRRSTVLDSDIMREIVQKRRETGRTSHKQKVLSLAWSEERGPIRLNKYISNSGICSRREADQLIIAGAVTVNGKIVTELGMKVLPTDEVRYEDKVLQREKPVYILLNKPKDYITTTEDDRDRDNVMMLIEGACSERVYPVGRLDRNSTGLLLFTNDGEMAKKLTHPRYGIKKIYQVELDRNMSLADFETLANGVELNDGFIKPDEIAFVDGQKHVIGITLHSGKNRIVRRMFDHLGYEVEKLDRVYYAGLTKKDLPRGEWRFLRSEEINILKMSL